MILGKQLMLGTGASASKDYQELLEVVNTAVLKGIRSFDTAPSYNTEENLGKILCQVMKDYDLVRQNLFIQTKIDPWQMQDSNGDVRSYVESALKKMQLDYIDSLLIHWPIPEYFENTWKSFVRLRDERLVRNIGICNVRIRHLKKLLESEFGPQIIQIERHPLNSCEREIAFCKENGIEIQAYSSLCKMDSRIKDSDVLMMLANKYQKNVGQIVLRWHIDTGVVPIFTSKKTERISEYTEVFDFQLTDEEIQLISELNINYKIYLESCICPGI